MRTSFFYKVVLVSAVLLSLQSCFVTKKYNRPTEVVQEEFFRTDQLPQDTLNMAKVSWREMFTDPFLTSYIEEALHNNIDIRIALQQMEIAGSYLKQGKANYFPALNAQFGAVHQELAANNQALYGRSSINQFDLTTNLSWEADIWGRIKSKEKAQRASFLQSVAAHKAVKTGLIANLASIYYQLLALDEQLAVTRKTVENREKSLRTIKALKDAGSVTEVGVQQTQAQLYRAQSVVIDLQNEIRLLENTFSILLGKAPHGIERSELNQQHIQTKLKTGIPVQLLRNRPDVIAAEYNLIHAFELTNVARSNFYPALRISASAGFQGLDLGDLLSTNNLFASIAGSLTQPIFNRRQIKTEFEVAKANKEIAFLNFRESLLIASREVSDALYKYRAAGDKMKIKVLEAESYDLATVYSEELLNNGLANYLEVLTARDNSLNAQLELINIRFNELNAIVDLYQALGGGWE